jgi:hypothetical protein
MKECKICKQSKPLEAFAKNKQQKDGHHVYCKPCQNEKYAKKWYKKNAEHHKKTTQANPNRKEIAAKYYQKNREHILKSQYAYQKEKYNTDPMYAMKTSIAATIRSAIAYKGLEWSNMKPRTAELLGCTYPQLKKHLEDQFQDWMTWDNRGKYNGQPQYGWDIDHIKPLAVATCIEELTELCHYTNLQPLCSYENRNIKRNRWNNE